MTEQKKPEPGQWLVMNDRPNTKVFLVGKNAKGQWVIEWEDGDTSVDATLDDWHHEPSCDSWTWQPPDWVPQDRVPARPGIDQRRWFVAANGACLNGDDWDDCDEMVEAHPEGLRHGDVRLGYELELRCLRKDLPPVQEAFDALCDVCGIGFILPSGVCDHCDRPDVKPDLKIYMSVDGILYAANEPQQTTHTRVRIVGDGVEVVR